MSYPLRLCVVGCGRVAGSHLDGIAQIPDKVTLAALVSRDMDKGREYQKKYKADKVYTSLEDAVGDSDIQAFDLCLPNHLHKDAAITCAEAGKHVLVEKPMANTVADSELMIQAADQYGITFMVGQSRRFYDAVLKSKELVDNGEIGQVVSITAMLFAYLESPPTDWWRHKDKAGGLMIPIWGSHIIDYILWVFGEIPERVFCETCSVNLNWEGEDEAAILFGFSKGRNAVIKMSWNSRLVNTEEEWDGKGKMLDSSDIFYKRFIQGTTGTLCLDDETRLFCNGKVVSEGQQVPGNFARELIEFAESIHEHREPITSGRKIIDVIRVQEAALDSAESGQVVLL